MTSVRGTSRTQHGRTDPDKNQHKTVVMETVLVVSCCHLLGSLKHCSWGIRDRGPQSRLCLCLRVYSCAYSREPTAFLLLVNFKLVIFDPDQSSAGHTRSSQTWSLEQECACAQVKVYMFQLGRACTVRVKVQIRCTDLLGWFWAAAGLTWAAAAGLRSSAADLREQLSFNMLRKCPKRVELQKESQAGRVQILYEREVSLLSTSFRSLSMRWFLSGVFFFFLILLVSPLTLALTLPDVSSFLPAPLLSLCLIGLMHPVPAPIQLHHHLLYHQLGSLNELLRRLQPRMTVPFQCTWRHDEGFYIHSNQ